MMMYLILFKFCALFMHKIHIHIHMHVNKTNIILLLDTAYVKCDSNWYECDGTDCNLLSESQIVVSLIQTYFTLTLLAYFYRLLMLIYFSMKLSWNLCVLVRNSSN